MQSQWLNWFSDTADNKTPLSILIAVFLLLNTFIFGSEVVEIVQHFRKVQSCHGFLRDYLGVWNFLDWATVIVCGVLCALQVNLWNQVDGLVAAFGRAARSGAAVPDDELYALTDGVMGHQVGGCSLAQGAAVMGRKQGDHGGRPQHSGGGVLVGGEKYYASARGVQNNIAFSEIPFRNDLLQRPQHLYTTFVSPPRKP